MLYSGYNPLASGASHILRCARKVRVKVQIEGAKCNCRLPPRKTRRRLRVFPPLEQLFFHPAYSLSGSKFTRSTTFLTFCSSFFSLACSLLVLLSSALFPHHLSLKGLAGGEEQSHLEKERGRGVCVCGGGGDFSRD